MTNHTTGTAGIDRAPAANAFGQAEIVQMARQAGMIVTADLIDRSGPGALESIERLEQFASLILSHRPAASDADGLPPLPAPLEIDWPELHSQALGCGVEDRGIRDRYEAAEYGWQDGVDKAAERVPEEIYTADQMREYALEAVASAGDRALKDMEARKDAAYLERNRVVAALAKCFPSGVAKTAIEGWSEDWHGCVYIDLPTGQASWNFHDSQAYLFDGLPPYTGSWDGHDTPEKYRRLAALPHRATATRADGLEPVEGDILPPVGSQVLIHLGRQDAWVEHTVTGYYVWGALSHQIREGEKNAHRVFVRVKDAQGYDNARLLSEVRPAVKGAADQTAPQPSK